MKIESLKIKNFKALRDVNLRNIPNFAVFLGANGSGKTTFFEVFDFLRDAFKTDVHTALLKCGGSRGFDDVRSRDSEGDIQIELTFRIINKKIKNGTSPLITYSLRIGKDERGRGVVEKEVLKYALAPTKKSIEYLSFSKGKGLAHSFMGETDVRLQLKSKDTLAIKGMSQFVGEFPAIANLGIFIEGYHLSNIHIKKKGREQEYKHAVHLSSDGDNLHSVIQRYHEYFPDILKEINEVMQRRVPGFMDVETQAIETGAVLLRIKDKFFEEPIFADNVSHGTIKMLAYLALLHDPYPHELLCVEEPENQLYPNFLEELAEDFRAYGHKSGQVFVSTHSPDFLNAAEVDEVFLFVKKEGYTTIVPAAKDKQVKTYMENGDKMGHLWTEGFFRGVGP